MNLICVHRNQSLHMSVYQFNGHEKVLSYRSNRNESKMALSVSYYKPHQPNEIKEKHRKKVK